MSCGSDTQLGPGARILAGARGRTCGPQALVRSANWATGLVRDCGHGKTAEAALPAHTLERAMAVALVPREDNAFANDNPPPARKVPQPHLAETRACSTFGETRAQHRANAVNDLNVQNRGDYFSAIFGLDLGGRPRLTSTRHDPRKAARRYSRPPRMPAFFAAASRPRRVGDLPAACSELM